MDQIGLLRLPVRSEATVGSGLSQYSRWELMPTVMSQLLPRQGGPVPPSPCPMSFLGEYSILCREGTSQLALSWIDSDPCRPVFGECCTSTQ